MCLREDRVSSLENSRHLTWRICGSQRIFQVKVVIISGPPVNDINFWTPEFVFTVTGLAMFKKHMIYWT